MKQSKTGRNFYKTISSQCFYSRLQPKDGLMKDIFNRHSDHSNSSIPASDVSYIRTLSIKEYQKNLKDKVRYYQKQSMSLFNIELAKYQSYYKQIFNIIEQHYEQGKHKITVERNKMMSFFQKWKDNIQMCGKEVEVKHHDYDYQDKVIFFQKYTLAEIDVIQIKFPELESLKKELEKYLVSPKQTTKNNKQNDESFAASLKKDQKVNQLPNKDKNPPTSLKNIQQTAQSNLQESSQADDLLGCDEELGAKTSPDVIRRRKYDVSRQNVIKQQDESDDTNSIVSDS